MGEGDDERLLLRARDGDARAFEAVYTRHRGALLAYLSKRVAGPELAADLLAECFAALLVLVRDQNREIPQSAIAWLLGTAKHMLIDSYRRGRVEAAARERLRMRPLVIEDRDMQRIEEVSAQTDLLAELERQLSPDQFEALRARVIDERDYGTIAGELECSEAVVRKRVSRALTALRARMGGQDAHG